MLFRQKIGGLTVWRVWYQYNRCHGEAAAVDDRTDDDDMEIEPTASPTLLEVVCRTYRPSMDKAG